MTTLPTTGSPTVQSHDIDDATLEPCLTAEGRTLSMPYLEGMYSAYLLFSIFFFCCVHAIQVSPEASASLLLRVLGLLVYEIANLCIACSLVLRLRAWAVKREGREDRFVQDIRDLCTGRPRSEAAVIAQAPERLMLALLMAFAVECFVWIWLRRGDASGDAEAPSSVLELALQQVFIVLLGAFAARCFIVAGKIGLPPADASTTPLRPKTKLATEEV
ncbi:hypothetical protein PsYK624_047810 [Phanerochaete sordida]|uniref:Uncharacterized protein n=1 Tax=Phanerochaete sordida TaxID=48140 RepID=A0A9P3G3Y8_9APHY|nr:hypothetical protein PsYK624_047810 [Phanerochaete sordida]